MEKNMEHEMAKCFYIVVMEIRASQITGVPLKGFL